MTTDERIARLEKRLAKVYSQAAKELADKANSYFERFKRMDEQKRRLVEEGKLTEKEYKVWRQNRIMEGKRWTEVQGQMAQTMTNANKVATAYINRELPPLYAQNFNEVGEGAERIIRGYSFDLTNANTVKNLSTQNKTLLPYKVVDGRRDVRWNTQRVNASVLQSILQGESIPQMAKRLATNLPGMNMESAVRNARTACTGAECKGRLDGMKQLEDDGVILKKEWIATTDARTREAHLELDGVQVDIDQPFVNSIGRIMYPGDPNADPANTYNCRCSIGTRIVGFKKTGKDNDEPEFKEYSPALTKEERKESPYKSAMAGANSPVEFWMNMTEEQQADFMASELNIKDVFEELQKEVGEIVEKEWKDANPGGPTSFAIEHDFSKQNVEFVQIKPKSDGWMADANGLGTINIREGGLGEDWDYIICHEAGHQLANSSSELQSLIIENPGDVFGRFNIRLMAFDGVYGEYNPEEAFATCVSNYIRHGTSMKEKYPDAYAAIDNLFKKSPSARDFVVRTMEKYRRMFR